MQDRQLRRQNYCDLAIVLSGNMLSSKRWSGDLFCRNLGRVPAVINIDFGYQSALLPFSRVEYSGYMHKGKLLVTEVVELVDGFEINRRQLVKNGGIFLWLEIIEQLWPYMSVAIELWQLLEQLIILSNQRNCDVLTMIGAWRMIGLAGYSPERMTCKKCGKITYRQFCMAHLGKHIECVYCDKSDEFIAIMKLFDDVLQSQFDALGGKIFSRRVLYELENYLYDYCATACEISLKCKKIFSVNRNFINNDEQQKQKQLGGSINGNYNG